MDEHVFDFRSLLKVGYNEWNGSVAQAVSSSILRGTNIGAIVSVDGLKRLLHMGKLSADSFYLDSVDKIKTVGMSGVIYNDKSLFGSIIVGADVNGSLFEASVIKGCIFYNTKFTNTNFNASFIDNSLFVKCDFSNCSMINPSLNKVRMVSCNISECNMEATDANEFVMDSCSVEGTDLSESSFNSIFMNSVEMDDSSLKTASISRSVLMDTYFKGTNLRNAVFLYSKIFNMNIARCATSGARFHDYNAPNIIGDHKASISILGELPSSVEYIDQKDDKSDNTDDTDDGEIKI